MSSAEPSRPELIVLAIFPIVALGLLNAFYKDALISGHHALYWTLDVVHFVVLPALGGIALARGGGLTPRDYGLALDDPRWSPCDLAGLGVVVSIAFALAYVLGLRAGLALWPEAAVPSRFAELVPESRGARLVLVVYLSLTAAFVEEVVYRALPWVYVRQRFRAARRTLVYAPASAVVFALIHSEQGLHALLATFVLGLAAGLLYTRIENLWPFVGAHLVLDLWSFWPE